jgi:hypothetical protein
LLANIGYEMVPSMAKTYSEKLKDPRWQRKRLEILDRDNFTCRHCRSKSETLHVHHSFYKKNADPWDYDSKHLVSLCEECHGLVESRRESILRNTASPHAQSLIWQASGVLSMESPVSGFNEWIISSAIRLSEIEESIVLAETVTDMEEAFNSLNAESFDLIQSVHRLLFYLEGKKDSIFQGIIDSESPVSAFDRLIEADPETSDLDGGGF